MDILEAFWDIIYYGINWLNSHIIWEAILVIVEEAILGVVYNILFFLSCLLNKFI